MWATTSGVGRAHRTAVALGAGSQQLMADDYAYVPKLHCDMPVNLGNPDCDSTIHNVYTQSNQRKARGPDLGLTWPCS